ncbi:MAG: hypothetical protein ACKVP0_06030 [Pirellulaceae bacterium]
MWYVVFAVCLAKVATGDEGPMIVAHKETQSAIQGCLVSAKSGEAEHWAKVGTVVAIAKKDPRRFVQQIVYFNSRIDDPMLSGVVLRLIVWSGVSESEIAESLAPYLYTDDDKIRTQARSTTNLAVGRGCKGGHPDLSHFRDHMREEASKPEVATPLRRWVFERNPNAAFLVFHLDAKSDELISLRRLERTVSNMLYEKQSLGGIEGGRVDDATLAVMQKLVTSKYWWSRLFASEIMVQHREFRDSKLIDILKSDSHELVKKSIQSIGKPDRLRASKVDE